MKSRETCSSLLFDTTAVFYRKKGKARESRYAEGNQKHGGDSA